MQQFDDFISKYQPQLLSILRIVTALLFLQHGLVKWFGFPTNGPANLQLLSLIGIAGVIEIVGSVLVAVGLFTRIAAFIMSGEMAVAYFYSHFPRGFYPIANAGEAAVLFCFVFLYLAAAGPGPWSVDAAMQGGRRRR